MEILRILPQPDERIAVVGNRNIRIVTGRFHGNDLLVLPVLLTV